MSETIRVSDELHEFIASHSREDETMEETLRRLIGGLDPDDVAGILSPETADAMRERIEAKRETDADAKRDLRERFE